MEAEVLLYGTYLSKAVIVSQPGFDGAKLCVVPQFEEGDPDELYLMLGYELFYIYLSRGDKGCQVAFDGVESESPAGCDLGNGDACLVEMKADAMGLPFGGLARRGGGTGGGVGGIFGSRCIRVCVSGRGGGVAGILEVGQQLRGVYSFLQALYQRERVFQLLLFSGEHGL